MFFRRAFSKNQHDYNNSKESFEEMSPNHAEYSESPPQRTWQMKTQKNNGHVNSGNNMHNVQRRGSFGEKEKQLRTTNVSAISCGGGLSVLQLTPIWEHIIRTNSLPHSINIDELFEEFFARLHDPEISVRSHALRVLVDVLIVMGQQADYHIGNILHPLVDNLGHIAPAVRKSALDALRVYVAQSAMPETVMLDIMSYGMNRPANDPFSGRLTVAIMLALPALILPVLITPKRSYVVRAVIDSLSSKMVQITYQEIALKILLKIKEMVGLNEFHEYMPINVKKDFDLLCKVYGLPKSPSFNDSGVDMHVPAYDPKKPWASKFVPKKDIQGNCPTSHAPIDTTNAKFFGGNYDATYPFERTRLSNNLGTPKKIRSPRQTSAGILRSSSEQSLNSLSNNNLTVEINGNSSGSESGGSSMSFQTQNNTFANSKVVSLENGVNGEKAVVNGKVIMETEIKITPETAVTMRILEQNPSMQTDDSDDENGNAKRIVTDFSAPYPVTPMKAKYVDDSKFTENLMPQKNGRRVRFGGEIIKIRTPDSDFVDQSDDNETSNGTITYVKENSNLSDNSSISSDNSTTNEYIRQANVGFINEPLSLNQLRNNIGQLKEKKADSFVKKSSAELIIPSTNDSTSYSRATPMIARPVSSRPSIIHTTPDSRPTSSNRPIFNSPSNSRPTSSHRPILRTQPIIIKNHESKSESSSSTDYSQELNIRIPDVETVLPAHFTPPNIMIKKNSPAHGETYLHPRRPATSPMISPKIITIPPTSSSSHSSMNNSPMKSAPATPNMFSPSKHRIDSGNNGTPMRRAVSSLSPRMIHREVTMLHNLTRSPGASPARNRKDSISIEFKTEEGTQTSLDHSRYDEMTQTPNGSVRTDEMTQTTIVGEMKCTDSCSVEESPCSIKESPITLNIYQQPMPEYKSWEELGIVDYYVLKDLKSGDFRLRSKAICAIEDALKSSDNLARVQPYLDSLLRTLLTSERHPDVLEDQRRVLSNLISRLPLENLEDRVTQIVTGLCRLGGAGSNLVAKTLMQRLPTAAIVLKLLSDEFLHARSSKFRENSLQMVIFALVTFPSTYFDINNCVERTTKAALDRKKRVRQAALDVLAVLGQISSPRTVINVVSQVADSRVDGLPLLAAVKARLARKQLPLISADGDVVYALRIPSATNTGGTIMFGSDVEWICSGSGSVSPTSVKNRSFKLQSNGLHGHQELLGRGGFEDRRIVDGLNRYAVGGANNSTKSSPWSRIPVRGGGSSSDDDHGYVAGTAFQGIQKPLESTGRFHGKLHSRSFPELSEKQPIRQLSDNAQPTVTVKMGQNNKQPVASTKLPNVETSSRSTTNNNKNPYSFAPNFKTKKHSHTSDGIYVDTNGSPQTEISHVDHRPRTHPSTFNEPSSSSSSPVRKQKLKRSDNIESPRKSSAKPNGNELTIQPITLAIGLVESDDATSEQNVIKTQPSAKSKKSEDIINNKDLVDNYVEEQVRRTSGKTNSHILSDVENSPLHLSKGSTSSVIENVRNEIAQIQSAIQGVKKEMEEMQKTKSIANTPSHKNSTRPASANSNKTFIYEPGEAEVDGGYERHIIQPGQTLEINASPQKARPATAKSVLKPESPFQRIVTPTPDDVITDDQLSSSPYDPIIEMPMEIHEEETEEISENIPTEIEEDERSIIDPMVMIRSDSTMTISRENINEEYEVEEEETAAEQDSEYAEVTPSPLPREVFIKSHRTPIKANRPAVLKRSHKSTPVKNPMPNLNQMPSVVIRAPKSNALFPPSLRRFDRPKDAMNTTMHQLESSNWEDVMEGLKNFVRLIRHHPEYVDSQIHLFTLAIGKQVKNLRSQVSRAGCSAAGEFFITHAKVLDADAEELAASLLNRTADTNKFLRADATRALESMCDALHPSKCILILSYRGASHQNAAVRCTTAKLLNELVFRIGCDKVFNMHKEIRDRLILTGANLLMEGSLETRNHTKELFKQLSIHSQYQKLLLDIIPSNVYRNIEKALKSIR